MAAHGSCWRQAQHRRSCKTALAEQQLAVGVQEQCRSSSCSSCDYEARCTWSGADTAFQQSMSAAVVRRDRES
jgi:hypothetical protein